MNYWHSAEFTWDGQYVVTNDESFTGTCQPNGDGKIRIWRVSDAQLMSTFMIPRPQGSTYCSVHNGNIIPVAGRYLLVAAWYGGGTSVVDFTNPVGSETRSATTSDDRPRARGYLVVVLVQRQDLRERHRARRRRLRLPPTERPDRGNLDAPERADAGTMFPPPIGR